MIATANTMCNMSKKTPLTREQREAARRLKDIWDAKKGDLTQEQAGEWMGISQGAVGHYLHGRNPLNTATVIKFAALLDVDPSEIMEEGLSEVYRVMQRQALKSLPELTPARQKILELVDWLDEDEQDRLVRTLEEAKREKLRDYEFVSRKGG